MAGPWDKYGGASQTGPVYGAPPLPADQFKIRDQQLQEEAASRAVEDQGFQRQKFEREMAQKDKESKTTDAANTAAFLATRVAGGMRDIAGALKESPGNEKPGILPTIAGAVNDDARNLLNNPARQRIEAAQMDVLDAALTLGTGAAYSKEQLAGYQRSYFPQIGDDAKTVADKQVRLRRLLEAAKIKAGTAAPAIDEAMASLGDPLANDIQRNPDGSPKVEAQSEGPPPIEVDIEGGPNAGLSQQEIDARIAAKMAQNGGGGAAAVMGAADTLSLGFGDELTAGGNAVVGALQGEGSFSDLYGQNIGVERGFRSQLQQEHPYFFGGGQLAGAVVPMGAAASGVGGLAKAGAIQGGAYGFGSGEGNALQRAPGALIGAGAGAGVGATLGAAAPYASNALLRFRPQAAAARQAEANAAIPVIEAGERQGLAIRQPDVRPGLRGDMAAVEKSQTGGPMIGEAMRADREAMEGKVSHLSAGEAKDEFALGNQVQDAVGRHNQRTRDEATVNYFRARKLAPNHKADPAKVVSAIDDKIAGLAADGETANAAEIKVLEGIKADLQKSGLSIDSLQTQRKSMRQRLKDNGIDSSQADASYMEIMDLAGRELEASLDPIPNAKAALRKANEQYAARKQFRKEVAKTFTGTRNAPVAPETAAKRFISMTKSGGDYGRFSRMFNEMDAVERADFGATIAEGLGRGRNGEFGHGRFVTDLEGMNPRAVRDLYGKEGAEALSDLKLIAAAKRDTAGGLNHSNTGAVLSRQNGFKDLILAAFGGGVAGVPGAAAGFFARGAMEKFASKRAARMLLNPSFTKWLRQTPNSAKPEVINRHFARLTSLAAKNPAMAADAKALQQFLGEAFKPVQRAAASGTDADSEK